MGLQTVTKQPRVVNYKCKKKLSSRRMSEIIIILYILYGFYSVDTRHYNFFLNNKYWHVKWHLKLIFKVRNIYGIITYIITIIYYAL